MKIFAIDPGAVYNGIAYLDRAPVFKSDWWGQYEDPTQAMGVFLQVADIDHDVMLLEDYSHGGTFTKEAKATIEVIGYVKNTCLFYGYKVVLRHKDQRLSGQGPAARLMGDTIAALKKDPMRKDAFSALSHCITYQRGIFSSEL